ncbi:MAG: hypothetical protein KAT28_00950 [Candidatus Aenigmarchaeota archaeon]|nr:hypothetical protein [Candidatus Aenigmarchaeota archaeon]
MSNSTEYGFMVTELRKYIKLLDIAAKGLPTLQESTEKFTPERLYKQNYDFLDPFKNMFGVLGAKVVKEELVGDARYLEIDLSESEYVNNGRRISNNPDALTSEIWFGYDLAPKNEEEDSDYFFDGVYDIDGNSKMRLGLGGLYYHDLTEKEDERIAISIGDKCYEGRFIFPAKDWRMIVDELFESK